MLRDVELGLGLYTLNEAARFVRLHPSRVRRWVAGYEYKGRHGKRRSAALFQRDLPLIDGRVALTFLDLVELRFVRGFLEEGVKFAAIRMAAEKASIQFKTPHPFTSGKFKTDGRGIFAQLAGAKSDFVDLASGQTAFRRVIGPVLKEIEHDRATDQTARWWPLGRGRLVVLDPARAMGTPIVAGYGVPTRVLYAAKEAGGTVASIARWYDVPATHVRDALRFETEQHPHAKAA